MRFTPPHIEVSNEKNRRCLKKKIAFMVSNLCSFGGTERVTSMLSKELAKYYECHVLTVWKDGDFAYQIDPDVKVFNLYDKHYRLRRVIFGAVKEFKKYIEKEKIEIVIAVGRNTSIIPILLKALCKIKLIYCEHNSINRYRFDKMSAIKMLHRYCLQYGINLLSDMVVTLTEKDLRYYQQKKINCCAIYNFVEDKLLQSAGDAYNAESNSIVTVANFCFQKGFEYLIEVAYAVLKEHSDWRWYIYGKGDEIYKDSIVKRINKMNITNIVIAGYSNDMYNEYRKHAIYVMTSRFEGLPMVLLEAKANGLPIVSFDIQTGPSDIVRDGIDGFLIKPFDTVDMSKKICELIESRELRQTFSNASRGNLSKFSKDKIVAQWCNLIDNL